MEAKRNYTVSQNPATRLLIAGGVIGPLLFIVVFLIEGATRPGYNAWINYVSSLSLSDQGWEQIAKFLVCGLLMLGFAIGLRQTWQTGRGSVWGPTLLGIFGLALVVAGVFVTDASLGYPPGTAGGHQTLHGTIHGLAGLVTFSVLSIACFVIARRFVGDPDWKGWALYSIITGILVAASFIASSTLAALDQNGVLQAAPVGLAQRVGIIAGWVWIALLAIRLLRRETMDGREGNS
jgi:hypothetical protein